MVSIRNFAADLVRLELFQWMGLSYNGQSEFVNRSGFDPLFLSAINNISRIAAEHDSNKLTTTANRIPPEIRQELAKIAHCGFIDDFPEQSQCLNLIRVVDACALRWMQELRDFKCAAREEFYVKCCRCTATFSHAGSF
jgi:hypothetical protein